MAEGADDVQVFYKHGEILRAVALYPWATMNVEDEMASLAEKGANAVFVVIKESDGRVFYESEVAPMQFPGRDLLAKLVIAAKRHDIMLIPSIFALCDKYLLEQHPEVVQVARDGTEVCYPNVSMEWMHWVCPNHSVVRDHLKMIVHELVEYDIDGIQLSHFEFQSIQNGESNYRSCFCEECTSRYEALQDTQGAHSLNAARCDTITEFVSDLVQPVREENGMDVMIEIESFANLDLAVEENRQTFGVDPIDLSEYADALNPRTAHRDLGMHPLWIRDITRSLRSKTETPILPSIRTAGGDNPQSLVPLDELRTAIQMALHGGSCGVSLFSTGANVGHISEDQWEVIETSFEEIEGLERKMASSAISEHKD